MVVVTPDICSVAVYAIVRVSVAAFAGLPGGRLWCIPAAGHVQNVATDCFHAYRLFVKAVRR